MNSPYRICDLASVLCVLCCGLALGDEPNLDASQRTAIEAVQRQSEELKQVNQAIWRWAEVGLEEHQSSGLLIDKLRSAGFEVQTNVAGMPTAFIASFGHGQPVIGILAEYDALPGMSQQVAPYRAAEQEGAPGHACGHSGLGTAALGAAIATKQAMQEHDLPGTIRLYGTPAEETLIGKVYMTLAGVFDDLDICLHWHPGSKNQVWSGSSKAMVSAKFTFDGTPAHASVSPHNGRSALDAVELMNVGANFMREHIKEDARLHYVITDGGGAPNVVPPTATVWYYCRADTHEDVEYNFSWLKDIAEGAAQMTRTKLSIKVDTDCHEIIPNAPLSHLILSHLQQIGAPEFSDEERVFARRLQEPLVEQFGSRFALALDERVHRIPAIAEPSSGSTDVGDISWRVPTGGLSTACLPSESPGHSWQNVASIGSSIGEKGTLYAAKALAVTAVALLQDRQKIAEARADWQQRMQDKNYFTFVPSGQAPPQQIR